MAISFKRLLIGKPLPTEHAEHERLTKILALPIFASDALSSVAYASEEIMAALLIAGTAHFTLTPWLSLAIVVLLGIVVISYRQTVMAYPNGGGAYIVARDNLGEIPAQAAGASLLVDYILTVSVSVSAGIAAINSLLKVYGHNIDNQIVPLCVLSIIVIALINLRGVRESGAVFAFPAYSFILLMYALVGIGLYRLLVLHSLLPVHSAADYQTAKLLSEGGASGETATFGLFLILHAFASGCTALTGVEAISNGVQAFKEPASRNAAITMSWLAFLLGTIFMGVSYLAVQVNALPPDAVINPADGALGETVLSQIGIAVFGKGGLYLTLQIVTCIILILAANTSFAGFPRLCALQAQDGFLPRQLNNIGDKLVFDNGIKILAFFSILLVIIFKGSVHYLIPLYAVGVFLSFTLSQAGMVKRWLRLKTPGWQFKAANNAVGAIATCIVTIIFGVVKFSHGAWVVVFLIPALIVLFLRINAHYRSVAKQLSLQTYRPRQGWRHHVLVLAPDIHQGVIPALQYARAISEDTKAIHVSIDPNREKRVRERWTLWSRGIPLQILPSPYRSLAEPILTHIKHLREVEPRSLITLIIPEFVPEGFWAKLLHGQAGVMLHLRLRSVPGVVVISVPYHIKALVELNADEEAVAHSDNIHQRIPTRAPEGQPFITIEGSSNGMQPKEPVS
ncbi:MAG: APC family permease [Abitibacteriaceae bacterium]|nr:APC family permease [Abditibacteriaceae bacterium]MBV9867560.1 APC family permease [Abditibacteriaceae bacterium]